jgi:hypothetical protein
MDGVAGNATIFPCFASPLGYLENDQIPSNGNDKHRCKAVHSYVKNIHLRKMTNNGKQRSKNMHSKD